MTVSTFYAPASAFEGRRAVVLPDNEARHALRVLLKRSGDQIVVVDGEGEWYRARLESGARARILEARRDVGEPPYRLSMGVGLLRSRTRFETFLEKAVELGVSEIIPMHTQRSGGNRSRRARALKILVGALKQCGRSRIPTLSDPVPFAEALEDTLHGAAFILHERAARSDRLSDLLGPLAPTARLRILVGPEGGFTDEELRLAAARGFARVSLGPRRLRAEIAAMAASAVILLLGKHSDPSAVSLPAVTDPQTAPVPCSSSSSS